MDKSEQPLPKSLFDIMCCPVCKNDVSYNKEKTGLVCKQCNVTYPIKEGIPVMLPQGSSHR